MTTVILGLVEASDEMRTCTPYIGHLVAAAE